MLLILYLAGSRGEKPIPDSLPLSVSAEMLLLAWPLRGSVPAPLTREVALHHRLH